MGPREVVSADFGGTWIRAGAVGRDGTCRRIVRRPTERRRPAGAIVGDLADVITEAGGGSIPAIAVGVPTVIDEQGRLGPSDNLPTMGGLVLADALRRRFDVPIALFNDALCFTVGEWWKGAGQASDLFCGITLGTGIGLGLVIGGRVHRGAHGLAGEVWKTPFEGRALEDYLSGRGIEDSYEARAGRRLTAEEIAGLAEQGDSAAAEIFERFGMALGRAVSFIVNLLDPELIAFGGSISNAYELFREPLEDTVLGGTISRGRTRLTRSLLGETAPLVGAARLSWEQTT